MWLKLWEKVLPRNEKSSSSLSSSFKCYCNHFNDAFWRTICPKNIANWPFKLLGIQPNSRLNGWHRPKFSAVVNKQNFWNWGAPNYNRISIFQLQRTDLRKTIWVNVGRLRLTSNVLKSYKRLLISTRRASCCTTTWTIGYLRQLFPGRVMSINGDIDWPWRSLDLTLRVF